MPDSTLELIINVNDPNQGGLIETFLEPGPADLAQLVRNDKSLAVTIRPVVANTNTDGLPWKDDHVTGDTYKLGIGNPDEPATAGTFSLDVDGVDTDLVGLAFDISAVSLQTPLSAASVTAGYGALTVTKPATGVYVVTWTNTGTAVPAIGADGSALLPYCDIIVSVLNDGDESAETHPQQVITIRQQLVALASPATALPAAGVTRTYDQTATATQNSIVRIAFDAVGTYGGLYNITVIAGGESASCGQIGPLATPQDVGLLLANHPQIYYQDATEPDNVIVSQDGADIVIEFIGTLAGSALQKTINDATVANPSVLTTSAAHGYRTGDSVTITSSTGTTPSLNGTYTITVLSSTTFSIPLNVTAASGESATVFNNTESTLTVTDVSLVAPIGVSGSIDLNTYNLANAFWNTEADELTFYISVERTRASGEVRTILLQEITLRRDIIDLTSLVPTTIPNAVSQTDVSLYKSVTGYTGGGSSNLDGIVTASTITTGQCVFFIHSTDGRREYQLLAGTDAEDSPAIIRPDDYNATTNARYWSSIS